MARRMVALVLLGIFHTPLAGQGRGFQPEDYYNIVSVSEVAVSPTGNFVAFTVTTVVEEENTRHQEIWLQPLTNGRPDGEAFRITDPTAESSSPSWSPDGALLSFSSKRGEDPNTGLVLEGGRAGRGSIPHRGGGGNPGLVARRGLDRLFEGSEFRGQG